MEASILDSFDREINYNEVFSTSEGIEFYNWLSAILGLEMLIIDKRCETLLACGESGAMLELPKPAHPPLPFKPTRYTGADGAKSLGIPVNYAGDTFALLLFDENAIKATNAYGKLRHAGELAGWYVYVIHQRRMISELHTQTETLSYNELLEKHYKVVESESRYKELSETLEQKVEARKKELEEVQKQLFQQEKMASIGQLAAGVAHEINNPTGFIRSNIQSMASYKETIQEMLLFSRDMAEKCGPEEYELFKQKWDELDLDFMKDDLPLLIEQSLKGTERIIRIVSGLSRFSHTAQDQVEEIDLNELIDSAIELLWNEIKHAAELEKDYGTLPSILGNPNQLGQVFVNLLVNAVQAIDKDGRLKVETRPVKNGIQAKISDNGMGISPEVLSRIFDPFYTTKPVGKGTGLGLSISYEIIQNHGGKISVESEPFSGTTFTVELPLNSSKEK